MNRNYDPLPRFFNIGFEPVIGKNCSLVNTLFDCAAQITLGDYVSTGHDVLLLTAKHNYNETMEMRQKTSFAYPITIEDGVWIASRVIICGNVRIGKNSVIGANSLVMCDVPANSFYAGSPAKLIREL